MSQAGRASPRAGGASEAAETAGMAAKTRPEEALEIVLSPAPGGGAAGPCAPEEGRDDVPWRPRWTAEARGPDGEVQALPAHPVPLVRPAWLADCVPAPSGSLPPFRLPAEAVRTGALSQAQAEAVGLAMQAFRRPVPFPSEGAPRVRGFMLADVPGTGRRRTAAAVAAAALLDDEPSPMVLWITERPEGRGFAERSLRAVGIQSPVLALQKGSSLPGAVHAGPVPGARPMDQEREAQRLAGILERRGGRPLVIVEAPGDGAASPELRRGLQELQLAAPDSRVLLVCDAAGPLSSHEGMRGALSLGVRLDPCHEPGSRLRGWRCSGTETHPLAAPAALRETLREGLAECRMPSLEGVPVSLEEVGLSREAQDLHRLWTAVWARSRRGLQEAGARLRASRRGREALDLEAMAEAAGGILRGPFPAALAGEALARRARERAGAGEAVVASLPAPPGRAFAGTPEGTMTRLLEACIPVRQMRPETDRKGNVALRPAEDAEGAPMDSPYAVARRARAVEACRMAEPVPDAADRLREALGGRLAEAMGRPVRPSGKGPPERRTLRVEAAEAERFEQGMLDAVALPRGAPPRAVPKAPAGKPVRLLLAGAGGAPAEAVAAAMAARGMGPKLAGARIVHPGLPLEGRLAGDCLRRLVRLGAVPEGAEARRAVRRRSAPGIGSPPWSGAVREAGERHRWGAKRIPGVPDDAADGPDGLAGALPELGADAQRAALREIGRIAARDLPLHEEAGTVHGPVGTVGTPFRVVRSFELRGLPGRPGARVLELEPVPEGPAGPEGEEGAEAPGLPPALRTELAPFRLGRSLGMAALRQKRSKGLRIGAGRSAGSAALRIPGTGRWLVLRPGRPPGTRAGRPRDMERAAGRPEHLPAWREAGVDVDALSRAWAGDPSAGAGRGRALLLEGPPPEAFVHEAAEGPAPGAIRTLRVRGPGRRRERPVTGAVLSPATLVGAAALAVRRAKEAERWSQGQ